MTLLYLRSDTHHTVSSIVVGGQPVWSWSCVLVLPSRNTFSSVYIAFSHDIEFPYTAHKDLWILMAEHFLAVKNFIILLTSHLEGEVLVNSILIRSLQLLNVFDFHTYYFDKLMVCWMCAHQCSVTSVTHSQKTKILCYFLNALLPTKNLVGAPFYIFALGMDLRDSKNCHASNIIMYFNGKVDSL